MRSLQVGAHLDDGSLERLLGVCARVHNYGRRKSATAVERCCGEAASASPGLHDFVQQSEQSCRYDGPADDVRSAEEVRRWPAQPDRRCNAIHVAML